MENLTWIGERQQWTTYQYLTDDKVKVEEKKQYESLQKWYSYKIQRLKTVIGSTRIARDAAQFV